jgi:polysaccharide export outer membrane protein
MEALLARLYTRPMTCIQRFLFALCVLLGLSGSAVAAVEVIGPPPLMQLGPGDQIKIDVFGNPDLTTTINVADDGSIRMPLAGAVAVGGQSLGEAARRIETALKLGQFLNDPQVTVTLVQSTSQRVLVFGEVKNPGSYPIKSNSTVFDAIALAGGISDRGSDIVYIQRTNKAGVQQQSPVDMRQLGVSANGISSATQSLQGGDTIIVPKGTFFIGGQVVKPGEYRIEGDMMLYEAIARAGGVTPMGSASRVDIRRRGPDGQVIEVKNKKNLRIQPGDVIDIKERLF